MALIPVIIAGVAISNYISSEKKVKNEPLEYHHVPLRTTFKYDNIKGKFVFRELPNAGFIVKDTKAVQTVIESHEFQPLTQEKCCIKVMETVYVEDPNSLQSDILNNEVFHKIERNFSGDNDDFFDDNSKSVEPFQIEQNVNSNTVKEYQKYTNKMDKIINNFQIIDDSFGLLHEVFVYKFEPKKGFTFPLRYFGDKFYMFALKSPITMVVDFLRGSSSDSTDHYIRLNDSTIVFFQNNPSLKLEIEPVKYDIVNDRKAIRSECYVVVCCY